MVRKTVDFYILSKARDTVSHTFVWADYFDLVLRENEKGGGAINVCRVNN